MRRRYSPRIGVCCVLALGLLGIAAGAPQARGSVLPVAAGAAAGSGPFLPWPPPSPDPRPPVPPGTPPLLPPVGPAESGWWSPPWPVGVPGDLGAVVTAVGQALEALARWAARVQQAASDALARMIWESPGQLPEGAGLPDLLGSIAAPAEVRGALDALLAKLRAPALPASSEARHAAYTQSSPELAHEAAGIATADALVTAGAARQAAAVRTTSLAAAGAAGDPRLPAVVAAGREAGTTLLRGAGSLPSTRAGVELLVAGVGTEMRQQAELGAAVGDRLTLLAQQTAEVSGQIGALATTAATLVAREAERDRRALDATLGLADVLLAGGQTLQEMLAGAGEPSGDEMRVDPLY